MSRVTLRGGFGAFLCRLKAAVPALTIMANTADNLERSQLVDTVAPYKGYATSDGAPAGASIVDINLIGLNDFVTGNQVIITDPSSVSFREKKTAGTFDPITGTIPFSPGFSHQIKAGTIYSVLTAGGGGGGFGSVSEDAIYFDQFNGNLLVFGNDGSPTKPLSLAADVATQLAATKLSIVRVAASEGTGNPSFTVQGPMTGISFWGDDSYWVGLALNNKILNFCDFHYLSLTGQCAAGGFSSAYNCDVDVTDENGWEYYDCTVRGYHLGAGIGAAFNRCSFPLGTVIHFSDGSTVVLSGTGDLIISDTPNTIWVFGDIQVGAITGTVIVNNSTLVAQSFQVPQPAAYTATVTIVSGGSNLALGTITIAGIPVGATVAHLFVHFLFGERSDSSGATNSLSGAQNLQVKKNAGGFSTFFSFAGGEYSTVASSQGGGDAKKGTVDLVALAPANGDVLTFQWTAAKSVGNNLVLAEFEVIADLWAKL